MNGSKAIKRAAVSAAAAAILVVGLPTTAVAHASSPPGTRTLAVFLGPANLDRVAIMAALRSGKSPESLGLVAANQPAPPSLVDYQAMSSAHTRDAHRGRALTPSTATAAAPVPAPFNPTKEPTELTPATCQPDSSSVFVQDRFDVCEGVNVIEEEFINVDGTPVPTGFGFFTDTLIGFAGFGDSASRLLAFDESISNVAQLPLTPEWNASIDYFGATFCTPVLGTGDCHSRSDAHAGNLAKWLATGSDEWKFTVEVDAGTGVGPDDIIKESLAEGFYVVPPPGYVREATGPLKLPALNVRWDNANNPQYIKSGEEPDGAAIFDYTPSLILNLRGQGTDEVAAHVLNALLNPNSTVPAEPPGMTKVLPGLLDNPLHRLYPKYQPPFSERRYNRNGAIARAQCGPRHGDQCDEYPMASTYEGAAKAEYEPFSDPDAYSVQLVNADQNGTAGNIAKSFYRYYRVLDPGFDANYHPHDWDSFVLDIEP